MALRFVFGTHYIVSAGKDRLVKYWDGDKFEQIMKLEGHHGEIWALAVGKYGSIVVSASHDKSIRVWEKTEDQFTIEEEREKELEDIYEKAAVEERADANAAIGSGVDLEGAGADLFAAQGEDQEVGQAGKKTSETLKAGERVVAALELWEEEVEMLTLYRAEMEKWRKSGAVEGGRPKRPARSPFVIAARKEKDIPEAYVLHVVEGVRTADLEQALLVLSFPNVINMLRIVTVWIEK
ncbi:hypothetical protein HK101_006927, partial [Irineochytrium annulatum]